MSGPVRARYTYHPYLAVLALFFAMPLVWPIGAWKAGLGLPGWAVPLIILVAARSAGPSPCSGWCTGWS